ncbi:hypothetical protein LIER_04935 [Lithospermum erythrorhizon]|uniref:Uncharacterized protein n=1 Tax=Lithospermum erythrorhizon TaxID=34254 RepID=A0AAV3NYL1_LITER
MCSSGSVFLVNLVKDRSFNPASMIVPIMSGENGASPANSVDPVLLWPLSPLHGDFAGLRPVLDISALGEYGYRFPPHLPRRMIFPWASPCYVVGSASGAVALRRR